jgi:hypothetical protein
MQINLETDEYVDKAKFGDEFVMIHSSVLLPSDAKKASIKPGRQRVLMVNHLSLPFF